MYTQLFKNAKDLNALDYISTSLLCGLLISLKTERKIGSHTNISSEDTNNYENNCFPIHYQIENNVCFNEQIRLS